MRLKDEVPFTVQISLRIVDGIVVIVAERVVSELVRWSFQ